MIKVVDSSGDSMTVKLDVRFLAGFILGVVVTYFAMKKLGYLNPYVSAPYFNPSHYFNPEERRKREKEINFESIATPSYSEYEM